LSSWLRIAVPNMQRDVREARDFNARILGIIGEIV
jgi:hypothetical protein